MEGSFLALPNEIIDHIMRYIDYDGLFQFALTCRGAHELACTYLKRLREFRMMFYRLDIDRHGDDIIAFTATVSNIEAWKKLEGIKTGVMLKVKENNKWMVTARATFATILSLESYLCTQQLRLAETVHTAWSSGSA